MRILGVNGIYNWSWGRDSFTDRILDRLKNHHFTVDVEYPRMTALLAYFQSQIDWRAERILKVHQPGDCVVAHSFGCLLTLRAMELGAKFDTVFFFGAAADDKAVIPEFGCTKLYNVHSTEDRALNLGKMLPNHPFGELGSKGYTGLDHRVENIPAPGYDHNQYAEEHYIKYWVNVINDKIPASF
jgi:hypothetical protein